MNTFNEAKKNEKKKRSTYERQVRHMNFTW